MEQLTAAYHEQAGRVAVASEYTGPVCQERAVHTHGCGRGYGPRQHCWINIRLVCCIERAAEIDGDLVVGLRKCHVRTNQCCPERHGGHAKMTRCCFKT